MRDQGATVYSRNGTAFFLDVGAGLFAVTAAHVIDWLRNFKNQCQSPHIQDGKRHARTA
jgi:hypothetical protein